jgi:hypothetical protein
MNLRLADPGGLVSFLDRVVRGYGRVLFTAGGTEVRDVDGTLFFRRVEPVSVGGPFASVEALVRSEGIRRYPTADDSSGGEPTFEIFEWEGSFFRIEGEGSGAVWRFEKREAARSGKNGALVPGSGAPGS